MYPLKTYTMYTLKTENEIYYVTNDICPAKSENDNKCIKYIAHINARNAHKYLRFYKEYYEYLILLRVVK